MDWSNPIVYELGLTIVALVGFAIWQTVDLKRAARRLKEAEEAEDASRADGTGPHRAPPADPPAPPP